MKLLVVAPSGVLGIAMRALLPAGDLVMMRKQLHNLGTWRAGRSRNAGS